MDLKLELRTRKHRQIAQNRVPEPLGPIKSNKNNKKIKKIQKIKKRPKNQKIKKIPLTGGVDLRRLASDIGDIRYINANTMPTHANKMDKTGGPPDLCVVQACFGIVLAFIYRIFPITKGNPT